MFIASCINSYCAPAERDVFCAVSLHAAPDGAGCTMSLDAINMLLLRSKSFGRYDQFE